MYIVCIVFQYVYSQRARRRQNDPGRIASPYSAPIREPDPAPTKSENPPLLGQSLATFRTPDICLRLPARLPEWP